MLQVCRQCATAYAVGLVACPQCGGTDWLPDWEEEDMPKTTYEGPSFEEGKAPPGWVAPAADDAEPEAEVVVDPGPPEPATTPDPVSTPPKSSAASSAPADD